MEGAGRSSSWGRWVLILMVFINISGYIAYLAMARHDINDASVRDNLEYIAMFQGKPIEQMSKPFRYRVAVPYLARMVPPLPAAIESRFEVNDEKRIIFRFAVVNLFGLIACGVGIVLLLRSLGFGDYEALTGSLIFYTMHYVSLYGGVPLVDTWSFAFIALGAWLIKIRQPIPLLLLVAIGMIFKETALLLLPLAFLLETERRRQLFAAGAVLIGAIPYLLFRFVFSPTELGYNYTLPDMVSSLVRMLIPGGHYVGMVLELGFAFGFILVIAFIGLGIARRIGRRDLVRLAWLMPIVFFVPILIDANLGRVWFLAFPAVLPLALLALRDRLGPPAAEPAA